jgi:hypothetical protein
VWWRQVVLEVEAELSRQETALDGQAPPACTEVEVLRIGRSESASRRAVELPATDSAARLSAVAPRPGR